MAVGTSINSSGTQLNMYLYWGINSFLNTMFNQSWVPLSVIILYIPLFIAYPIAAIYYLIMAIYTSDKYVQLTSIYNTFYYLIEWLIMPLSFL